MIQSAQLFGHYHGRYTLNLSDELFHSVEKRFIDCLAELTKLM